MAYFIGTIGKTITAELCRGNTQLQESTGAVRLVNEQQGEVRHSEDTMGGRRPSYQAGVRKVTIKFHRFLSTYAELV